MTRLSLPALLLACALPTGLASAQTGTLDQDNTQNNNLTWNMTFFQDLQQDVQVTIPGQLEGFQVRVWSNAVGNSLPVSVYLGPGPHVSPVLPAWTGAAVATATGFHEVFCDTTSANLLFNAGDVFTIRVGDTTVTTSGIDLSGNAGWPNPYYVPSFYEDGNFKSLDRLYFRSYMLACPNPPTTFGQGCAGFLGTVPSLSGGGCPAAGGQVTIQIEGGLPGSSAILVFGLAPANLPLGGGCALLVAPLLGPQVVLPLSGTGGISVPGVIPPTLSNVSFSMQAFVIDATNPIGASSTNGLTLTIP